MAQELRPIDEVRGTLTKMQEQIKAVLPSHIDPEKFNQVVVTALQLKPDLLTLDRQSLYSACLACASDGLIPDNREAALVPYKGKIAYQPMVGGILKLIRNSGELASIDAVNVFENDQYEAYTDEKGVHFKHVKARGERGVYRLTFAYAITKDGAVYHEEIESKDMDKIEACAKTKEVWGGAFKDEQRRKSAIKRLSKRLPKSTDLEKSRKLESVIDHDNEFYDLNVPTTEKPTTSTKLSEAVTTKHDKAEDAELTPAPQQEPQPPAKLIAKGLIVKVDIKNSPANSDKKWTKFGCKIEETWYSTFDKKIWEKIEEFANNKVLVNLEYVSKTVKKEDKEFVNNEIVAIEPQVADVDVPI